MKRNNKYIVKQKVNTGQNSIFNISSNRAFNWKKRNYPNVFLRISGITVAKFK